MKYTAIVALFVAVASADPLMDAYKFEKQFYKEEADKKKDAERAALRAQQSYAQVQDPALKDVDTSSFSAMVNGAMDANNLKINQPAVNVTAQAMVQKKSKSKYEFGALKGYADTDEILDMNDNVNMEGLYGLPSHQTLLFTLMTPSNQDKLEDLMLAQNDEE